MVDLVTIRDGPSLVPATRLDLDQLEKVRSGTPLRTAVTFARSNQHMRWYRALVGVVADAIGLHPDTLHAELKFKAGFVRRILMSNQFGVAVELESAAFAAMDETRFTEFRTIAVELLFRHYLEGVNRAAVFGQVYDLLGEPCPWQS